MPFNHDNALIIFSGGQDSTTCLIQAIKEYGQKQVETISFYYGQRHQIELDKAKLIATDLGVKQTIMDLSLFNQVIATNALVDLSINVQETKDTAEYPNTFVDGRNALFLLLAACYAKKNNIHDIITGVCETDYSGYPDCRDIFIKSMNVTINLALDYSVNIKTPLMYLTKAQTWELADKLGYLEYIQQNTHTCYYGIDGGCRQCPSCLLREKGLHEYLNRKNDRHRAGTKGTSVI